MNAAIAVSCGAVCGALSRYYLGLWLVEGLGEDFPYATFTVNIIGSFVMGAIVTLVAAQALPLPKEFVLLLTVGFLGSFTTFSSYILDSTYLLESGRSQLALVYWLGSPICGFLGLQVGMAIGRFWGQGG